MHAISSLTGVTLTLRVVEGTAVGDEVISVGVMGLATFGIALIALTGWAFWLSKAVRTMPALGLGYPAANGLMAFYENFIPVLNLWRVPAIVRERHRLEPGESRGDPDLGRWSGDRGTCCPVRRLAATSGRRRSRLRPELRDHPAPVARPRAHRSVFSSC